MNTPPRVLIQAEQIGCLMEVCCLTAEQAEVDSSHCSPMVPVLSTLSCSSHLSRFTAKRDLLVFSVSFAQFCGCFFSHNAFLRWRNLAFYGKSEKEPPHLLSLHGVLCSTLQPSHSSEPGHPSFTVEPWVACLGRIWLVVWGQGRDPVKAEKNSKHPPCLSNPRLSVVHT